MTPHVSNSYEQKLPFKQSYSQSYPGLLTGFKLLRAGLACQDETILAGNAFFFTLSGLSGLPKSPGESLFWEVFWRVKSTQKQAKIALTSL